MLAGAVRATGEAPAVPWRSPQPATAGCAAQPRWLSKQILCFFRDHRLQKPLSRVYEFREFRYIVDDILFVDQYNTIITLCGSLEVCLEVCLEVSLEVSMEVYL